MSSISDSIIGPDQIDQKNRIVTGQNRMPTKGERYLIQSRLRSIFSKDRMDVEFSNQKSYLSLIV